MATFSFHISRFSIILFNHHSNFYCCMPFFSSSDDPFKILFAYRCSAAGGLWLRDGHWFRVFYYLPMFSAQSDESTKEVWRGGKWQCQTAISALIAGTRNLCLNKSRWCACWSLFTDCLLNVLDFLVAMEWSIVFREWNWKHKIGTNMICWKFQFHVFWGMSCTNECVSHHLLSFSFCGIATLDISLILSYNFFNFLSKQASLCTCSIY